MRFVQDRREWGNIVCEKRLIERAKHINGQGKMLAIIVDDAHLMDITCLRRLRLLLEDFPKNHNLILMAQPSLLTNLSLSVHEDIKSRITYSVLVQKLTPDDIESFILSQLGPRLPRTRDLHKRGPRTHCEIFGGDLASNEKPLHRRAHASRPR